jgi:hypothetical protein
MPSLGTVAQTAAQPEIFAVRMTRLLPEEEKETGYYYK